MPKPKFFEIFTRADPRIILLVLSILIYAQTLFFGKNLDDFLILGPVEGKIHSFTDLLTLLRQPFNQVDYRPVAMLSFGLEQLIFGKIHYGVSHAINVLLHYLILLAGLKLLKRLLLPENHEAAVWAMLLFACSPVNTEVVASIKSRDTLFSLLFTLLALQQLTLPWDKKLVPRYLLGIALFLLAMFAKRDSAGLILFLPGVIILRAETPIIQKAWRTAVVIGVLLLLYQLRSEVGDNIVISQARTASDIGRVTITENPLAANFTFSNRIAAGIQTSLIYAGKLLCPVNLRFYYGFDHYTLRPFADAITWLALLFHFILLAGIGYLGNSNRSIWVAALGYGSFIAFALNFIAPNAGIVADRYAFQAGIWFWLTIVLLLQQLPLKKYHIAWLFAATVIYTGVSAYRTSAWKDRLTLLQRDMPHLDRSFEAQRIAAGTYLEYFQEDPGTSGSRTYLQKALEHARNANAIYPNNVIAHKLEGIAAYNLERYSECRNALKRALKNNPDDPETLEILGDLSYVENDFENAGQLYSRARILAPASEELINKISSAIFATGNSDSCLRFNMNLIRLEPQRFAPYENLGYYYLEFRDTVKSKYYFEQARKKGLTDQTPL